MAEDSRWGYVEGLARYCLEMAVVADGLEDWVWMMISSAFLNLWAWDLLISYDIGMGFRAYIQFAM